VAALDELERIAGSLNQAEVRVVRNDADAAGELAGQAAEKIAAACWILGSRLREREPGHLAAMTRDAVNGYQTGRRREGAPSRPAHRGRAPRGRPSDWTAGTSVSNPSENERVCKVASPNTCSAQGFLLGGVMLPEDEQRQLQEIEQALCRDDPKFVRLMRAGDPWVHSERKLLRGALLGLVIGIGLLPAGAVTHRLYLEAAGVVLVVLSLVWAVVSWRRYVAGIRPARSRAGTTTAKGTKHRSGQTRRARMMERMAQRWRRRQEGDGGMPGRTRS